MRHCNLLGREDTVVISKTEQNHEQENSRTPRNTAANLIIFFSEDVVNVAASECVVGFARHPKTEKTGRSQTNEFEYVMEWHYEPPADDFLYRTPVRGCVKPPYWNMRVGE